MRRIRSALQCRLVSLTLIREPSAASTDLGGVQQGQVGRVLHSDGEVKKLVTAPDLKRLQWLGGSFSRRGGISGASGGGGDGCGDGNEGGAGGGGDGCGGGGGIT